MSCEVCGLISPDEDQDPEYDDVSHFGTIKHICNAILYQYKVEKGSFSKNRDGICIFGAAQILGNAGQTKDLSIMTDHHKIRSYSFYDPLAAPRDFTYVSSDAMEISRQKRMNIIQGQQLSTYQVSSQSVQFLGEEVKPKQAVKFNFNIGNEMNDDILIVGIHLAHPQPQFVMNEHPYIFGETPHVLKSKDKVKEDISVKFVGSDIGQYEMPIMFTFHRQSTKKNTVFIREMVVMVEENPQDHQMAKSPYTGEKLARAEHFIHSLRPAEEPKFKIPPHLKILFPRGLEEKALEGLQKPREVIEQMRRVLIATRAIFDEGITKDNYMLYFHHLLWWEETIVRINLRKYNMPAVTLSLQDKKYVLEVPGLSEKRPSLLRGDRIYLQPKNNQAIIFESVVRHIDDNFVHLGDLDPRFQHHYSPDALFMVRFIMSRVPMERSHEAISRLFTSKQDCRVFPVPTKTFLRSKPISKFYNPLIKQNEEQRSAVEHIVAGTSGKAPYIVWGPPGTGKTMTIVEAIVQLVALNPRNRVMVCTDSNMAADHIALMLLKYNKALNINNFILRANSQSREWSVMPAALAPVSNGTSFENFVSLKNNYVANFRIVVTTLMHAAKYASDRSQGYHKLQMSHLFIDEAAQASEPHTLVPISGLLAPTGQLVLAGDPQQLGPVLISKEASRRGLGASLLERLLVTHTNLYENNASYMTMLVKNFRSDVDILKLPNQLFYNNELMAMAPPDPISKVNILGEPGGDRAIVFHAVHSREQKNGNAPSYFNEKELDMLKRYVKALINNHKVSPEDIGIIAPYIRQVYKMKAWLTSQEYSKIEVGTVEAFQGQEKRVILVSTVRANCRLLDYDALYGLGFLVDDKRFNVTLTRAKAKLVIIGNPTCLCRDLKWELYMEQCKECGTYLGMQDQQLDRTAALLKEVAKIRFDRCGLTNALKDKEKDRKKKTATR